MFYGHLIATPSIIIIILYSFIMVIPDYTEIILL